VTWYFSPPFSSLHESLLLSTVVLISPRFFLITSSYFKISSSFKGAAEFNYDSNLELISVPNCGTGISFLKNSSVNSLSYSFLASSADESSSLSFFAGLFDIADELATSLEY
jgi:hypothetical protein